MKFEKLEEIEIEYWLLMSIKFGTEEALRKERQQEKMSEENSEEHRNALDRTKALVALSKAASECLKYFW